VSWAPGRDQIGAALNAGDLQHVTGGQAAGEGWISDARRKYATAQAIADAVEQAVRAQFGTGFAAFGTLRRRRAELEYPSYPGEEVEHDELIEALAAALQIIDRAAQLIGHLSIFIDA
jgi:hypothetical protein